MIRFPDDLSLARYYLFDRLAEGLGSKTAIRFGDRSWTYDAVADKTRRMAAVLTASGVRRGERVLIILPDVPPFAWVFFGTLACGAVVAMGNPLAPPETLRYLVVYTRATCVVTVPAVAEILSGSGPAIFVVPDAPTGSDPEASVGEAYTELAPALAAAEPMEPVATHRDEPAIWLFTSGSTGEPKANIHTHRDFAFNTEVYAKKTVGYRRDDVTISVPRLFFGYATGTNLMFPFAVGAPPPGSSASGRRRNRWPTRSRCIGPPS